MEAWSGRAWLGEVRLIDHPAKITEGRRAVTRRPPQCYDGCQRLVRCRAVAVDGDPRRGLPRERRTQYPAVPCFPLPNEGIRVASPRSPLSCYQEWRRMVRAQP